MNNQNQEKSLLRIVGEGGVITTIGNLLLKFAIVLSTIIILRYVSVYDYGLWQLILSLIGFLSFLTLSGAEDILLSDLSKEIGSGNQSRAKAILIHAFLLFIILGFITALVLFFIAPLVSLISKIDLTYFLRILSLYFIFASIQRFYSLVFSAHLKFVQIQAVKLINRLSYVALLMFFIFFLDKNLAGVVYAYIFSLLPALLFFSKNCLKTLAYLSLVAKDRTYSLWTAMLTHGKWGIFTDYLNNLFASFRPWVIGYFLNINSVAIFSVAMNLLGEVMNLVPLRQIFAPIIPRYIDDKQKIEFLYQRIIKYSLVFYTSVGLFVFMIAPYFVKIFFPQYLSALPFFNILLFTLVAMPFGVITSHIFYAMKIQKKLLVSTIIPKGVAVMLLPLLLNRFGLYWAAIIQVSASLAVAFMSVYFLRKIMPNIHISWKNLTKFDQDDNLLLRRVLAALFSINKKSSNGKN